MAKAMVSRSDGEGAALPTIDADRHELARTANYEVQMLAITLRDLIESCDVGSEISVIARGILTRISDLSDVVYESVINDDNDREDVSWLASKVGAAL